MTTDADEGQELLAILQAVEAYNAKATAENRLTRLTLLLAMDNEKPFALLAGPDLKTLPLDSRKLH